MKTLALLFGLLVVASTLTAQTGSINNTLGSGGSFTIKDGATTFFSLSQSDGHITLPAMSEGMTHGAIFKGAERFLHDYAPSGSVGGNTFVGINSGNFTMSGSGDAASNNTAVGYSSLTSLTAGLWNSAFGTYSLSANTTGGDNSAFGFKSLWSNTTGSSNSAFGVQSLQSNTFGFQNSAFGGASLAFNNEGNFNSAFGYASLFYNTTGDHNSAFGRYALHYSTGNSNSAFGVSAGTGVTTGSNNTCIGSNAQVPDGTGSNQVRIGNTNVTYAGVQVAWTVTSDRRWKSDVLESDLGLEFIAKLNPVSYSRKHDEKRRAEYGFIAQEIETTLKEAGVENAGMLTIDDRGRYELRYNDLLAPMVKAIQELKKENEEQIATLQLENDALRERLSKLENHLFYASDDEERTVYGDSGRQSQKRIDQQRRHQ